MLGFYFSVLSFDIPETLTQCGSQADALYFCYLTFSMRGKYIAGGQGYLKHNIIHPTLAGKISGLFNADLNTDNGGSAVQFLSYFLQ